MVGELVQQRSGRRSGPKTSSHSSQGSLMVTTIDLRSYSLGWNSKSILSCQGVINWVCQPPLQLRGVGIYSHGCKQGLFPATWRPGGIAWVGVPDSAIMRQGGWYSSTMVAMYTRACRRATPPGGWNDDPWPKRSGSYVS